MQQALPDPAPLALVACSEMWMSRSLESVFEQNGYALALTRSAAQTIKLALRTSHDLIVLDESLEDVSAIETCRSLRDNPLFDHSTPIIVTSPSPATRGFRMTAYAAGAWECYNSPIDFESLFLRMRTFIRARRELAGKHAQDFIDPATGLYSSFGLRQLAGQFGALAQRNQGAFACVAFSAEPDEHLRERVLIREMPRDFADVANVFRAQSRKSDVVGHINENRLAILAPDTDAQGARLLVRRLQRELDRAAANLAIDGPIRLRAGYSAVPNLAAAKVEVEELMERAESALERVPRGVRAEPVLNFDDLPNS